VRGGRGSDRWPAPAADAGGRDILTPVSGFRAVVRDVAQLG
jgi:hypothetical protein